MSDGGNIQLRDSASVIDAFGGIRPMAHKLDVPVSTVQGWKERDAIPDNRVADIVAAALKHGVDMADITRAPEDTGADNLTTIEAAFGAMDEPETSTDKPSGEEPAAPPQVAGDAQESKSATANRGAMIVAVVALVVALALGGWLVLDRDGASETGLVRNDDLMLLSDRLAALETQAQTGTVETLRQQLSADIADLRAAIGRVDARQSASGASAARIDALANRLEAVERDVDRVESQASERVQTAVSAFSGAQQEIDQVRQQLAKLNESQSVSDQDLAAAVGIALTAGRLQRALQQGDPYADLVARLRGLTEGDAATGAVLDRLDDLAARGVPTRSGLMLRFADIARDVVSAADVGAAESWTDRTLQRVRGLVTVRRVGPTVTGDSVEARIARAEARLSEGDLSAAVSELDALEGAAASVLAPWLAAARTRLAAEDAVDQLETLALARLQGGAQ